MITVHRLTAPMIRTMSILWCMDLVSEMRPCGQAMRRILSQVENWIPFIKLGHLIPVLTLASQYSL